MASINNSNDDDEKNRKSYEKIGRIYNLLQDKSLEHQEHMMYLEKLLQTKGDINNYNISESGLPNLLSVVSYENLDHLELLLDHGFDVTYKDEQGRTAIHAIIEEKLIHDNWHFEELKIRYIKALLAAQMKFNNPSNPNDRNGVTHFHAACIMGEVKAVEFFLNNGVDVNHAVNVVDSPYTAGFTPLHFAVKYRYVYVVKMLLKHGANVHAKNAIGSSPLHEIVKARINGERGNVDTIFHIFTNHVIKANFDFGEDLGFTRLHAACYLHNESSLIQSVLKVCENVVDQAVSLDSPICPGFTPLHFAVFCNFRVFELLLEKGADIRAKNARGLTAFDLMCSRNKHKPQEIHSVISTINEWRSIVLSDNQTKLLDIVSAVQSDEKFIKFALSQNIIKSKLHLLTTNVHVPMDSKLWPGYTVLHIAVVLAPKRNFSANQYIDKEHDCEMIMRYMELGANDVTAQDAEGSTPIHLAFNARKYDIAELLLNHHYERTENPVDKNNLSHFHIACALGHKRMIERFLSHGVNANSPGSTTFTLTSSYCLNPANSTALHYSVAVEYRRRVIEKLLKHGADVNAKDANGFTPVHRLISQMSHNEDGTPEVLLSDERLENSTTLHGNLTHLHVACFYRHVSSIEKLLKNGADPNARLTYKSKYPVDKDLSTYYYGFSSPREDNDYSLSLFIPKCFAGYTPLDFLLHDKLNRSTEDIVKIIFMLIEHNADITSSLKGLFSLGEWGNFLGVNYLEEWYKTFSENATIKTRLRQELGITELHLACCLADDQLVEGFICSGVNVDSRVNSDSPIWRGYTPLHCTVQRAVEKFNAEKNFDCDFIDRLSEVVGLLMKHGADLLLTDEEDGNTPLHLINLDCNADKLHQVSLFVSRAFENLSDFSLNNPTNLEGISLLHIACVTHDEIVIEKLLKQGNVDVNRTISYFSKTCPGSTALHLLIKYYLPRDDSNNHAALLRMVDMLLDSDINVNAQDAFGNTPLLEAIQLSGSIRAVLIKKLISNGADVHTANVKGITAFELLLMASDQATWEEIELFLKAGCHFNTFNSITGEGYLAKIFRSHYQSNADTDIVKNQRFLKIYFIIMNNPDIIVFTRADGRTVMHNLVSADFDGKFLEHDRWAMTSHITIEAYTELIKWLFVRGCDIDQQDDEGQTALHLAVRWNNFPGVAGLLNNGADVNLTDYHGATIFEHYTQFSQYLSKYNLVPHLLAMHVYKLKFCGQPVSKQTTRLRIDEAYLLENSLDGALTVFRREIARSKTMKIGTTYSSSVYEFLTSTDNVNIVYKKMTMDERREVDQFIEKIDEYQFVQIGCILKLKYRKLERLSLLEPALESFSVLIKWQLPDLCCEKIVSSLNNEDLKRLIRMASKLA